MRAAVRRSASARPGVALDGDDRPDPRHQRGEMGRLAARRGAQVEHAVARPRPEQPRDRHRRARLRHEAALAPTAARRTRRTAPSSTSPSGRPGAGWRADRQRAPPARRGRRAACSRAARPRPARCPAAISARAASGPERVPPQRRDPLGVRVAQRRLAPAWLRRAPPRAAAASRAPRRSTALTSLAPPGDSRLASSTDSPTAAWAGHAIQVGELVEAEPQRGPHQRLELRHRAPGERLDQVVERRPALHRAVGQARRQRALARVQPEPARLAVERAVGPGALLEDPPQHGERARTRRGTARAPGIRSDSALRRSTALVRGAERTKVVQRHRTIVHSGSRNLNPCLELADGLVGSRDETSDGPGQRT